MRLDIHCKLRIWLGALGLLGASLASAQTVVAEATMVIGDAQITAIDGQARALARGGAVREGERIQTGPSSACSSVDGGSGFSRSSIASPTIST